MDDTFKDGLISGYKNYVSKGLVEIFLKYDSNNKCTITRVKCLYKPSLQNTIRMQQLVADTKNTVYTGIVRTASMGFLSNRKAVKNKTGGIYLVKFF